MKDDAILWIVLAVLAIGAAYYVGQSSSNPSSQLPNVPQTSVANSSNTGKSNVESLPSIIKKWSPNVALILCKFSDGNTDFGSGFLTQFTDGIRVVTNKHVFKEEKTGEVASICTVRIPGDDTFFPENDTTFQIAATNDDWGLIPITNGDTYLNNVAKNSLPTCQQQAQTGDSVIVLGYPDYAGQFTEPTATQGIVSGYVAPYYTTSAQIESGNSGGVAIDPNRDCYIGVPSAVQVGNYANLGRILNANVIFK